MSEPDIATLARRLAEQNNVDWRTLSGTGPDGKIVERDVLDYLARVMAGEEAVNPTPEPLPEGMEAWPDQDAPAYFKPNGQSQAALADEALQVVEDAADDLLADLAALDDDGADLTESDEGTSAAAFDAPAGDAWEPPAEAFSADVDLDAQVGMEPAEDVFADPATDAAASEGVAGAIKRAELYLQAGAEVIFPEALTTPEDFRQVAAALPGVPLLANMTEFGRTPYLTAEEFEELGYKLVIWPVSSLRVANKAQSELYATLHAEGGAKSQLDRMQTRQELYDTIDLAGYEELDAAIVKTILPD